MQDLEFPAACHRLKLTPDGQYLFASGTHAPRVTPSRTVWGWGEPLCVYEELGALCLYITHFRQDRN